MTQIYTIDSAHILKAGSDQRMEEYDVTLRASRTSLAAHNLFTGLSNQDVRAPVWARPFQLRRPHDEIDNERVNLAPAVACKEPTSRSWGAQNNGLVLQGKLRQGMLKQALTNAPLLIFCEHV